MKLLLFAFLIVAPSCLFFDSAANNQVDDRTPNNGNSNNGNSNNSNSNNGNSNNSNSNNGVTSNNGTTTPKNNGAPPEPAPIIESGVTVIFKSAADIGLASLGSNNFALVSALSQTIRVEVLKNTGAAARPALFIGSSTSTISVATNRTHIIVGTDNELHACSASGCNKLKTFPNALEVKVAINNTVEAMALLIRYENGIRFAHWDRGERGLDPTLANHAFVNGAFENLQIIAAGDTFLATAVGNGKLIYFRQGATTECTIPTNLTLARGLVENNGKPISIFPGSDLTWQNEKCDTGNRLMFDSEFDTILSPYDLTYLPFPSGDVLIAGKQTSTVLFQVMRPEASDFKYISSGSVSNELLDEEYDKLEVAINNNDILIVFLQDQ